MKGFLLGALVGLVVNALTIVGWFTIGPLVPAALNAFIALVLLGICGLENKWAFPLGYWLVELLAVMTWLAGMMGLLQIMGSGASNPAG